MVRDYELGAVLVGNADFALHRARRTRTAAPVLIKLPRAASPRSADAAALRRECSLALELPSAAALLPRIVELGFCHALVMEDPGGEPLSSHRGAAAAGVGTALAVGVQLATALDALHRRGFAHRGLRPEAVLFDAGKAAAWLVDLGDANPASAVSGTVPALDLARLVYAAPEQTGRVDHAVDARSDLYALGVLLYELLCGAPPFAADDALELIHRHIAGTPVEPCHHDPEIPQPLSAIVMRLLAKAPDERYQSARGLAEDLQHCARQWAERRHIDAFALGRRDASGQLTMPSRLYGRDAEVARLMAAFERCSAAERGPGQMLLVEGYAGIGKTALIQQLVRPIVRQRGYFISGKFDQVARGVPFGALIQAFRALVQQLLSESEAQLAAWREALAAALGGNGGVLAEVIPEIEFIVGPQAAPAVLGSIEAQNRFQRVLHQFRRGHRAADASAGAVSRRPAMGRRRDAGAAGAAAGQRRVPEPAADRRAARQRARVRPAAAAHAGRAAGRRRRAAAHRTRAAAAAGPGGAGRRHLALRARRGRRAGAADRAEDRRQPVLRHPVSQGAGTRGPAALRCGRAVLALRCRRDGRRAVGRQRGRADDPPHPEPAAEGAVRADAGRLHRQPLRRRHAGDRQRTDRGADRRQPGAGAGRRPGGGPTRQRSGAGRRAGLRLPARPRAAGGLCADPRRAPPHGAPDGGPAAARTQHARAPAATVLRYRAAPEPGPRADLAAQRTAAGGAVEPGRRDGAPSRRPRTTPRSSCSRPASSCWTRRPGRRTTR